MNYFVARCCDVIRPASGSRYMAGLRAIGAWRHLAHVVPRAGISQERIHIPHGRLLHNMSNDTGTDVIDFADAASNRQSQLSMQMQS